MPSVRVTARFRSGEELEAALCDLRRLGAVRCTGGIPLFEREASGLLHVSVREMDASLARAILRRAGGAIL